MTPEFAQTLLENLVAIRADMASLAPHIVSMEYQLTQMSKQLADCHKKITAIEQQCTDRYDATLLREVAELRGIVETKP